MKTMRFYVKTTINLLRKCPGNPDCKCMENMFIDFIWQNVQVKSAIQTISYHFKLDMAFRKWPKCLQYMQRTWWQIVATQHTGLSVLSSAEEGLTTAMCHSWFIIRSYTGYNYQLQLGRTCCQLHERFITDISHAYMMIYISGIYQRMRYINAMGHCSHFISAHTVPPTACFNL